MVLRSKIKYRADRHGTFEEEWLPHKRAYDCWRCSGYLHDFYNSSKLYAYHLHLHKLSKLSKVYYQLFITCTNISDGKHYQRHFIIDQNIKKIDIDADSIFCGEEVQLLMEKEAMALRVSDSEFGLELCLLKNKGAFWQGELGRISPESNNNGNSHEQLFDYFYPQMTTYGRIRCGEESARVKGKSVFERTWGNIVLKRKQRHWESIHLMLNNNEELNIVSFPHSNTNYCAFVSKDNALVFPDAQVTATECFDCEKYLFAKSWQVQCNDDVYLLQPLSSKNSNLPFHDMVMGIFDSNGDTRGYALSSSWVGARANEPGMIDLSLFRGCDNL